MTTIFSIAMETMGGRTTDSLGTDCPTEQMSTTQFQTAQFRLSGGDVLNNQGFREARRDTRGGT
jgi:hypothetical protein